MAIDYVSKICDMDRQMLLGLWTQIAARDTPDWPPGRALEYLVLQAFRLEEADVTWPYTVKIQDTIVEQIDGFVSVTGINLMVETKDFRDPVAVEPIAKLRNQLARRQAGLVGCVFSFAGFTEPAGLLATYCAPHGILLWPGPEIEHALQNRLMVQTLVKKHARLLQRGVPDYDVRVERPQ
jgi:hypothetical protein